ncbi:MDR efflux pump AcrAB transcriptional activator RobA [Phytobacter diazotrophicus]|jgi:AraC family transcriptional activator of mar-sox-rob regulon|uniref:MDR efflux pump AcrAB transcriptional activator RobA n=1 Tax=Citrobacter bitternis TaxID=1585982 RepID=A0ABW1PTC6_9ENTR|nr:MULTISPECIES: MDR efflux pump AcrAB transcriptional activator RobA [Enterobacteriaceae]AUU89248.1 MDR efflux pump AcrAB transcriptional activator RobA [Enterobacteriaceae bacterium ENNIH3]AUV05415.1 MDR efflux pump AcrAB transcriptional activator RobA [Enterobacteriaceae bacterium ENNIH2]MBS6736548.1 MDR efflux pump AcrAB transcriptional activator RobA [Enterobacteriaceae bacterium]PTA94624.1 MDR efflux pump AcrAB transcriptional activator RobA [Kluyvera sp. Nf5]PWF52281.1 MDR efflux pump A
MDQAGIIRDLLTWLESHLDQPLSLDNVAAKAGYSKWHLQRMFKDVTGHAIGAYIRARRLSKSAVALRLTSRPILDIALQYRFDSQQTFTRAFKKQFNLTPALYRRSPDWSAFGIRPPLRLGEFAMPRHEFITLPDMQLIGTTQSYTCSLEEISDFRNQMRIQFWRDFLGNSPTIPAEMYGLHEPRPSLEKDDEQEVFYTTALTPEMANGYMHNAQPVKLEGGEYVMFFYEGPGTGVQEFILTVYGTCMPMLNLTRRKGQDIERFYPQEDARAQEPPLYIRCEYLIPVRR